MKPKSSKQQTKHNQKMKSAEREPTGKHQMAVTEGGFKKENPPQDDCCPICFGTFNVPCRTSCGHWFCSSCILQYWGYSANYKWCKCPVCADMITQILPHPTVLNQPTEEESKILKDVEHYNNIKDGGFFQRMLGIPTWAETRRRFREDMDDKILAPTRRVLRVIAWVLFFLYHALGFKFIPLEGAGIMIVMVIINLAMVMVLYVDAFWYHWKLERRERREAVAAAAE